MQLNRKGHSEPVHSLDCILQPALLPTDRLLGGSQRFTIHDADLGLALPQGESNLQLIFHSINSVLRRVAGNPWLRQKQSVTNPRGKGHDSALHHVDAEPNWLGNRASTNTLDEEVK